MPGHNTTIEYPHRLRNWVWYLPYPLDSEDFNNIMTDIHNVTHRYTLPAGLIRPEIWTAQKDTAKQRLDTNSANLIGLAEQPFIQAITEVVCDRCQFLDGKVLLVGDAFSTFRPLSGQGTNQGAKGAMALKEVFAGESTLGSWESSMKEYAEKTQAYGIERERQAQLHQG
ncbi:MAG: hypothetical protein OHK93_008802 [Ramalina farinacea]|uniref:2,6-dihydroxypyridine 3-monooxygenase substrate binding domain-containing protein n=1 Tax=Ramalina farinacea TaxID=258253 RepID=A0AA43QN53_9LECA|nr:hypothetical protein [Ramalina farinacea]